MSHQIKWSVFKWCVVSHVSQMAFLYIKRPFLPKLVYTITQMYSWKWKFQLVRLTAILHITWELKCELRIHLRTCGLLCVRLLFYIELWHQSQCNDMIHISDSVCLPQTVIISVGGLWKLLVWYCKQKNSCQFSLSANSIVTGSVIQNERKGLHSFKWLYKLWSVQWHMTLFCVLTT